jgi:hypothetical protein
MRGMPVLFGGLVLDPEGKANPRVNGGCSNAACTSGSIYIFDKPAQGWESIDIRSKPYPNGRAGHTMTGTCQNDEFMKKNAKFCCVEQEQKPWL